MSYLESVDSGLQITKTDNRHRDIPEYSKLENYAQICLHHRHPLTLPRILRLIITKTVYEVCDHVYILLTYNNFRIGKMCWSAEMSYLKSVFKLIVLKNSL